MAGSMTAPKCCAGVTGNKALPTWLITMLLLLLLIWLTEKMFVKAFKVHASEKERERWADRKSQEAQEQGPGDNGERTDKYAWQSGSAICVPSSELIPVSLSVRLIGMLPHCEELCWDSGSCQDALHAVLTR